jgi:hypothetical protein
MPEALQNARTGHAQAVYAYTVPVSAPADGSETDTTYDLPADGIVTGFYMIVDTAEATGGTTTLNVGLLEEESGGDADGFGVGLECSVAGYVLPTLASGGQTLGALLRADESGAGVLVPEPHSLASVTAKSVSITAGSADWAEFEGRLVFLIARDPDKRYP